MTILESFSAFGVRSKSTSVLPVDTKNAVVYTRVSTKEQSDKNLSLSFQRNTIEEYAIRSGITVLEYFGGTYESAKTDGRKEFMRMLEFIKKNKGKISHLLVYTLDRFSRTGGAAIKIAQDLREKHGISVFAVTQPTDTSNPSGVLHQNMQLLFSEFDNQLRRQRAIAGMREKIKQGIWIAKPPQGYDIIRRNGERLIVVNEVGKKIRKAFQWKAQGMKNEEIILKLRAMGVPMYKQQLTKLFKKPFYCGIISHSMLEGKVIESKHEKLISPELFLKVNNINSKSFGYGVPHKKEDKNIPLKVFIKCDDCSEPFTGYIVKAKKIYYYKCRTIGCKCNKNADKMHSLFENLLQQYTIKTEAIPPLQYQLEYLYHEQNKEAVEQEKTLKSSLNEAQKNIDSIEESYFIKKEMSRETYDKLFSKYQAEKANILKQLENYKGDTSNLENYIVNALTLSSKLPVLWTSSPVGIKEKLQKLVFPGGIYYNKQNGAFRTEKVNSIFAAIAVLSANTGENEKGTNHCSNDLSPQADRTGLEPATSAVTGQHSNQLNYRSKKLNFIYIKPPFF